ncbi:amidase [Colletotrichum asianum]|uniref:Amidase n=1 Tax=Colletotrichum asianum TaxID=702518 RepID=A0A8H3ZEA8_9PEZI|nr:amidase [Colletotrichum asianum]
MEYIWMGNFCRLLGLTLSASYVVPHDRASGSSEAGTDMENEHSRLNLGLDAEELFSKEQCRSPDWVDL